MEKISFEIIISSLFNLGFDKVDPVLFTYTLGKLSTEDKNHEFVYEQQETSIGFNKYVDCSSNVLKLKEGYTLDTNVSQNDSKVIPVRKTLYGNKKFLSYLENIDFNDIISRKAKAYEVESADEAPKEYFSQKEIDILRTINNSNDKKLELKYNRANNDAIKGK